ncbi:MAG: pyrroline-5-carboxylate reductase [Clostridia bacterium]|nr:pyrroline-5-carboxylate reductase [Clostridia bacterium]
MRNRLAFIGAGNMGCAIANGILLSKMLEPSQLVMVRRNIDKLADFKDNGCEITSDVIDACKACDAIMLCVKPQMFGEIMPMIAPYVEGKLVISIAAGITVETMQSALHGAYIVRVMPNTPLMVGRGVSAICYGNGVSDDDKVFSEKIFSSAGMCFVIEESLMNAVPAVTSSSIAYFARIMGDMFKWAKENGFDGIDDKELIDMIGLAAIGTAEIISKKNMTPDELVRAVASPRGTTEEALKTFDKLGLDETISAAMTACTNRANELSGAK